MENLDTGAQALFGAGPLAQDEVLPALHDDLNTLVENVNVDGLRVAVYNPVPWTRDGVVNFPFPYDGRCQGTQGVKWEIPVDKDASSHIVKPTRCKSDFLSVGKSQ